MKRLKEKQGITLIALVLTIIVLLILAGVAIAMLSGENGILKKAAEAKTKTEEGQKKEETTLTDMDLDSHFIINNSKYKCKYGMVTGVGLTETVDKLENALPEGYEITKKYDKSSEIDVDITGDKSQIVIGTGMVIEKDGKECARVVKFGDVEGDETIDASDSMKILQCRESTIKRKDFIKAAMDVNHDGKISVEDQTITLNVASARKDDIINQSKYVSKPDDIIVMGMPLLVEEYINNLPEEFTKKGYKLEQEDSGVYVLKVPNGTTGADLTNLLENSQISLKRGVTMENDIIPEEGATLVINIEEKYGINQLSFGINLV